MRNGQIVEILKEKCCAGYQRVYSHESRELNCKMQFSVYEPDPKSNDERFDVFLFLSGASCNEKDFIDRLCAQIYAKQHRFIIIAPDTSPRVDTPGDTDNWLVGKSAGWYVDALMEPWTKHYRMYSYITKELPELIKSNFRTTEKIGICGHSMGGLGAIVAGLRNPDIFSSISSFAPSKSPRNGKAVETAFSVLLGKENRDKWNDYDSYELVKSYDGPYRNILVDIGTDDDYYREGPKCLPEGLKENPNKGTSIDVTVRMQKNYSHTYFCVQSFIGEHFVHHKKYINNLGC